MATKKYSIIKTGWLGNRFQVIDASGRTVYEVQSRGFGYRFFHPGVAEPIFESRSVGFLSSKYAVVEVSVQYEFAYYSGYSTSGSMAVVMNVSQEPVGFVIEANTWSRYVEWRAEHEAEMESRGPIDVLKQALKVKPTLRAFMQSALVSGKGYKLISLAERVAASFDVPKDKKSIAVEMAADCSRYFDERLVLTLAVRCLAAQYKNNGA